MKRTIAKTVLAVGVVAMAALASPVAASAAEAAPAAYDLEPIVSELDPVASELGLFQATAEGNGLHGTRYGDFGTTYGDVDIWGKQNGLVNTNGAPLVDIDARCLDAQGGIGGYVHSAFGNSAKCNVEPVNQYQDGGILG